MSDVFNECKTMIHLLTAKVIHASFCNKTFWTMVDNWPNRAPSIMLTTPWGARRTQRVVDPGSVIIGRWVSYPMLTVRTAGCPHPYTPYHGLDRWSPRQGGPPPKRGTPPSNAPPCPPGGTYTQWWHPGVSSSRIRNNRVRRNMRTLWRLSS